MSSLVEKLSFANFEPACATEPYLNSPRSLDACRLHGVEPEDLIEVPFREFQKAFPGDDEEATLRRYQRMDGVRRILLDQTRAEWKKMIEAEEAGLKRPASPKKTVGESIIDVDPVAHTTLLEIQAQKLRKIEHAQWTSLKKLVQIQLKEAINEEKRREVLARQNQIAEKNNEVARNRMLRREQLLREQHEKAKEKELENARLAREAQKEAAREAARHKQMLEASIRAEKKRKAELEAERQREIQRIALWKQSEKQKADDAAAARLSMMELQSQQKEARMARERAMKNAENAKVRKELQDKLERARDKENERDERRRAELNKRIKNFEDRIDKLHEDRNRMSREAFVKGEKDLRDRIERTKQQSEKLLNDKVQRTIEVLDKKSEIARKELERAADARSHRKMIKGIKLEAWERNKEREDAAEAYRLKKIKDDLDIKEAKAKAIKDGYVAFRALKDSLAETVAKSKNEIKSEVFRLIHKNSLDADKLEEVVVTNATQNLFPRLHTKFDTVPATDGRRASSAGSRRRSPSPKHGLRRSVSPGHFPLHEFVEERLPEEMAKAREMFAKRELDKALPISAGFDSSPRSLKAINQHGMFSPVKNKLKPSSRNGKSNSRGYSDSEVDETRDKGAIEEEEAGIQEDLREAERHGYGEMGRLTTNVLKASIDDRPVGDVTSDEHLFFQPIPSLNSGKSKRPMSSGGKKGKSKMRSARSDEFRREYSRDHPLAGGKGRYDEETAGGSKHPVGWTEYGDDDRVKTPRNIMGVTAGSKEFEKVVIHVCGDMHRQNSNNSNASDDPLATGFSKTRITPADLLQREIDEARRRQNQALLDLLEQERVAEEERGRMGKLVKDADERHKLELVFAEERKRASDRIIAMTRQHELNIKELVLKMNAQV